jgi:hypothetical protein
VDVSMYCIAAMAVHLASNPNNGSRAPQPPNIIP